MRWALLALLLLIPAGFLLSRRPRWFLRRASLAPPAATGVEGVRRLGKKTRAALDAATTMLH